MLTLHRRLLRLRRSAPALHTGAYDPVDAGGDVLAFLRTAPGGARYLVALNLGPDPARLAAPGLALAGRVALSTHPDRDGDPVAAPLELRGDEGVVVELG
jgi:alpha-glucosidase